MSSEKVTEKLMSKIYHPNSGRCYFCGADTLWGDAPHGDKCEYEEVMNLKAAYQRRPHNETYVNMVIRACDIALAVMERLAATDV